MAASTLEKYIRKGLNTGPNQHPEVSGPRLGLKSDEGYGNKQFSMSWWPISQPFVMVKEPHKHDFDQFVIFVGGDMTNMVDLGGEVEFTLSEDGINLEKFLITEASTIFIPKGLYHCPLNFKAIYDPKKPILFHDLFFSAEYRKV